MIILKQTLPWRLCDFARDKKLTKEVIRSFLRFHHREDRTKAIALLFHICTGTHLTDITI